MRVIFDFSELRGRIIARYAKSSNFAKALGISDSGLSGRLNNILRFRPDEIVLACELLDIPAEHIGHYFFTPKV